MNQCSTFAGGPDKLETNKNFILWKPISRSTILILFRYVQRCQNVEKRIFKSKLLHDALNITSKIYNSSIPSLISPVHNT